MLVAVTADGTVLERHLSVDDPSPEKVAIGPGKTVKGLIDLRGEFREFEAIAKRSELLIFWGYRLPKDVQDNEWAGGWLRLPQSLQ